MQPCMVLLKSEPLLYQANSGDCLAAGFIAAALKGLGQDVAVAAGLQAAIFLQRQKILD